MFRSVLVANRGEIARRVFATARRMGLDTVAVFSEADADAPHVHDADKAVLIGPAAARESYLVPAKIIAAAKASGAEAIHPGYGFLSENAEFAEAVTAAGLIWIGPPPAAIRAMGLKDAAKALMAEAGVPVTPGYLGEDQDETALAIEAKRIGYPVLIKAVAGGGGKGMRRVDKHAEFEAALESAKREAMSAFGSDRVLVEKWVSAPRHIEFQIFADTQGNTIHLNERDCSLQRRHQKVMEEAPAPGMDATTRAALGEAAVRAAKAVDYVGAGTIEFIADASEGLRADRIWFMEMNTRLQVEHPVTEEITGVDLVEWQLRVASGEPLPLRQDELSINGWAMEARLYAEDPAKGFLPSVGTLVEFDLGFRGRIETGVELGDDVSPYYDPMIAKLVAKGRDRNAAGYKLLEMVRGAQVWPVKTNAMFLGQCLLDEEFIRGEVDTGLIQRKADALTGPVLADDVEKRAGVLNLLQAMSDDPMLAPLVRPDGSPDYVVQNISRISELFGFRLNRSPERRVAISVDGVPDQAEIVEPILGNRQSRLSRYGDVWNRMDEGFAHRFSVGWRVDAGLGAGIHDGTILSPMPGRIIAVEVAAGDAVVKGQKLLTLEAMKMEHSLTAPFDGVVAELNAVAGGQVQVEALLVRIEAGK